MGSKTIEGSFMRSVAEEHLGIAVVDDDPVFRELTCALLSARSNFVPFPAASRDELFDVLSEQRIDCIVLDYDLGGDTGLAIKTTLDERILDRPPIVMLTGDGRESTAIKAFRMGVSDYLPKLNLQPKALVSTITSVVTEHRRQATLRAEHRRLTEAAAVDPVTGLESRVRLDERLAQLRTLEADTRRGYATILIELLEYQSCVATFGFRAADVAIRAFSKLVKDCTRSNDICGIYAPATFLIIADVKADPSLLRQICERLAHRLKLTVDLDAGTLALSGCVAGTLCQTDGPERALDGSDIIEATQRLLASAKAAGAACATAPAAESPVPATPGAPARVEPPARPPASPTAAAERLRTTDRRREPRHRVLKRGIIHAGALGTFDCTVRNLSSMGAGLRIESPFAVPELFDLEIVGSGTRQKVRVRWQVAVDVGVEFAAPRH